MYLYIDIMIVRRNIDTKLRENTLTQRDKQASYDAIFSRQQ